RSELVSFNFFENEGVVVFAWHPRITAPLPALLPEFFFPPFRPARIQAIHVQRGIEVVVLVLQNPGKPTAGFKIARVAINIKALATHMVGTLEWIANSRYG